MLVLKFVEYCLIGVDGECYLDYKCKFVYNLGNIMIYLVGLVFKF